MPANSSDNKQPQREPIEPEIIDITPQSSQNDNYRQKFGGINTGYFWTPINTDGCAPFVITLALFLGCLIQFGILAAIGFFVFHLIGSVLGITYGANRLIMGKPVNPWALRILNWTLSFMLTAFLATH